MAELVKIKWADFGASVSEKMFNYQRLDFLTDAEIKFNGRKFKVHKIVLAAASPVFEDYFTKFDEPPYSMSSRDIDLNEFEALISLIYTGSIKINPARLNHFKQVALYFKLKIQINDKPEDAAVFSSEVLARPPINRCLDFDNL